MQCNNYPNRRFPWIKDRDPSSGPSYVSSSKQVKKPKLSVSKKQKKKATGFVDTDDDFVTENPGPSTSNPITSKKHNELTEQEIKRKKNREK